MKISKVKQLCDLGYKLGTSKIKDSEEEKVDSYFLYVIDKDTENKKVVITSLDMDTLEENVTENFEDYVDILDSFFSDDITDENMKSLDEEQDYCCPFCDAILDYIGEGCFGDGTAWCPCCGEYRSIY